MAINVARPYPIIIVTGANSGVGFAVCQRLIEQLASPIPPDSLLKPSDEKSDLSCPLAPTQKLSLILACRNKGRAEKAQKLLWDALDKRIRWLKSRAGYNGHAEAFRKNLTIDFIQLDLASMDSVFSFTEEVESRYPYVSHIVMNAGFLPIIGLDYIYAIKEIFLDPARAVTQPRFMIQAEGLESPDGLGMVFQSNVLGHFSLFRELEGLLHKNPSGDSRVQWLSSLDCNAGDYDPADIQIRRGTYPYEASKFQEDLIVTALAHQAAANPPKEGEAHIQHSLSTPGICHTANTGPVLNFILELAKQASFYLARLFGSQNHPIDSYKGAVAVVYAILAPLAIL
ncbi:hypothetical protein M422DRAFT_213917, partial [Sphaerobolus stellatus SS14]